MVWGLEMVEFGMFFPSGEFPGEDERIKAIGSQLSDEEKAALGPSSYSYHVYEKIAKDTGPVPDHELPKRFVTTPKPKKLGSLLKLAGGVRAVDETLKNIIERLEPGVHQFWPLQIFMPNGDEHRNKYYGMLVLRHLDSFAPEKSDPDCWRGQEIGPGIIRYSVRGFSKERYGGLAMSGDLFGSSHIWKEDRLINPTLFISNELKVEIDKATLTIPKHHKLKVV